MFTQSANALPGLSCYEDISGRISLRDGQKRALLYVVNNFNTKYPIQAVTGYGKTIIGVGYYCILRAQGRVNRCLYIAPGRVLTEEIACGEQKNKYGEFEPLGIKFDFDLIGQPLIGRPWFCNGESTAIKANRINKAEFFVTTVQAIAADPSFYADLMSSGEWCALADEMHRYPDEKTWGEALKSLNPAVWVGLSATPLRTDGSYGFLGEPVIKVDLLSAHKEKAIRRFRLCIEDYFIDVSEGGDQDNLTRLTAKLLRQKLEENTELDGSITEYELKKELRYHTKYRSIILDRAIARLRQKQCRDEGKTNHQMIVYAMSCKHAEIVNEQILSMGIDSDWVGSGPNGRDDFKNGEVISKFKKQEIDCLVQVAKAGEGFNSKHCSVIVFLNLLAGRSVQMLQFLGRGLRRDSKIDWHDDWCDVFVPADSSAVEFLKQIETDLVDPEDEEERTRKDSEGTGEGRLVSIPPFVIIDVAYKDSEMLTPLERDDMDYAVTALKHKFPQEDIIEALKTLFAERRMKESPSEQELIASARRQLNKAVGIYVHNLIILRWGKSYEKSAQIDTYKKVNKKISDNFGVRDSLMADDLKKVHDWVRERNEELKFSIYRNGDGLTMGDIPEWAQL